MALFPSPRNSPRLIPSAPAHSACLDAINPLWYGGSAKAGQCGFGRRRFTQNIGGWGNFTSAPRPSALDPAAFLLKALRNRLLQGNSTRSEAIYFLSYLTFTECLSEISPGPLKMA